MTYSVPFGGCLRPMIGLRRLSCCGSRRRSTTDKASLFLCLRSSARSIQPARWRSISATVWWICRRATGISRSGSDGFQTPASNQDGSEASCSISWRRRPWQHSSPPRPTRRLSGHGPLSRTARCVSPPARVHKRGRAPGTHQAKSRGRHDHHTGGTGRGSGRSRRGEPARFSRCRAAQGRAVGKTSARLAPARGRHLHGLSPPRASALRVWWNSRNC